MTPMAASTDVVEPKFKTPLHVFEIEETKGVLATVEFGNIKLSATSSVAGHSSDAISDRHSRTQASLQQTATFKTSSRKA